MKNAGKKVAKACSAYIRIEKDGRVNKCKSFSAEPKVLKWISPLGKRETSIVFALRGEQYLEIIFSNETKNSKPSSYNVEYYGIEKIKVPPRAYAYAPTAYENKYYRN